MFRKSFAFILSAGFVLAIALAAHAADRGKARPYDVPDLGPKIAHHVPGMLKGNLPVPLAGTVNAVADSVLNLRGVLGGGRHVRRLDCPGGSALSVTFSKDVARPKRQPFHALSVDEGATWSIVAEPWNSSYTHRDLVHAILGGSIFYGYTRENPDAGFRDVFAGSGTVCDQMFSAADTIGLPPLSSYNEIFLQMEATTGSDIVYASFNEFNGIAGGDPYDCYVQRSVDAGVTWSTPVNIGLAAAPAEGWTLAGMDGALSMAADGDFVAGMGYAQPDSASAASMGLIPFTSYPVYTQSSDGGATWSPMKLVFGTVGADYPHGHSGDPFVDPIIHYVYGAIDAAFAAFNRQYSNAVLSGGTVYLASQLSDTSDLFGEAIVGAGGGSGIFLTKVENGGTSFNNVYAGFPEDIFFANTTGIGVGFGAEISTTARGDVAVSWVEFPPPNFGGDICANILRANADPDDPNALTGPMNLMMTDLADETYKRSADVFRSASPPCDGSYVGDWAFLYYGSGGNALDSTLYQFQSDPMTVGGIGPHVAAAMPGAATEGSSFNDTVTVSNGTACATDLAQFSIVAKGPGSYVNTLVGPLPNVGFSLGAGSSATGIFGFTVPNTAVIPPSITFALHHTITLAGGGPEVGDAVELITISGSAGAPGRPVRAATEEEIQKFLDSIQVRILQGFDGATPALAGGATLPRAFALGSNFPNPFNPSTTIPVTVAAKNGEAPVPVHLAVYNLRGELVTTLVDRALSPGSYVFHWDGTAQDGAQVSSGLYIYRLQAGDFQATRKMVLLK